MQLSGLTRGLRASAAYRDLLAALHHATTTSPILRAARPFMLATLAHDWHAPIIYVTARGKRAHNVSEQLPIWLADTRPIYRFAEPTPAFYDRLPWDNAVIQSRLEALAALNFTPSPSPITPSPLAPLPKGEGNLTPPLYAVERGQGGEDTLKTHLS
jgi:hypothetical protein